ncbi:MAG: FtsB family cell division protein [Ktedonobacteraceae bacterium]
MQSPSKRAQSFPRPEASSPYVTSAVGMEETVGRLRARRSSLFTQTVIWITGLVCLAFLLGSLAQAWSNSLLMQDVQKAQQQLQQIQDHNASLHRQANHYKDPLVIESEARQQLGYIRPGEHPIIIVSSTSPAQSTRTSPAAPPAPQSYWQEWWHVFFGN